MNNSGLKPLIWLLIWSAAAQGVATAQESSAPTAPPKSSAPKSTAQIDAGEPRANTSPAPASPANAAPATSTSANAGVAASSATSAASPATSSPSARRAAGGSGRKAPTAADRVDLSTATVTGDREQPKVMYIVPWKKSDIGDLSGKPMNSLLDEALAPVDRDEFKREVVYYDAVSGNAPHNDASPRAATQGEK